MDGGKPQEAVLEFNRSKMIEKEVPMKRWIWIAVPILALSVAATQAQTLPEGTTPEHSYVGADKCIICHKSEKKGNQAKQWKETRHAQAYATLGTDAAKEVAEALGLGNPQEEKTCLGCHVTGYFAPPEFHGEKWRIDEGVSCESCHGAGGDYWKMKVMKVQKDSINAGMIIPNEETCLSCHNDKSPTFKEFNYEERAAAIAHPRPAATE